MTECNTLHQNIWNALYSKCTVLCEHNIRTFKMYCTVFEMCTCIVLYTKRTVCIWIFEMYYYYYCTNYCYYSVTVQSVNNRILQWVFKISGVHFTSHRIFSEFLNTYWVYECICTVVFTRVIVVITYLLFDMLNMIV